MLTLGAMPHRAPRPCRQPGCPEVTRTTLGYCPEHTRSHHAAIDSRRDSAARRGYDAKWREVRARVLTAQPTCVECGRKATEVDHIVAIRHGGTHDLRNLRALCKSCHSKRSAGQAFRRKSA